MELLADHAFKSARASGFDQHGKPLVKRFTDLFNREKVERELLKGFEKPKRVDPKLIKRFAESKARAEAILNGETLG